uniref:Neur_chan_LBD domain-containing protein n=2 Tax=Macrostomum lignano TaxID=282301 RepID=A0A1I8HTF4_9PLAT
VLRCVQCSAFQVHQCKQAAAKRWQCSLCGLKQSYLRVYAQGAAKACREAAQSFNMRRGEAEQAAAQEEADYAHTDEAQSQQQQSEKPQQDSKIDWNVFLWCDSLPPVIRAANTSSEAEFVARLLAGYEKHHRPPNCRDGTKVASSTATIVRINIFVNSISSVSVVDMDYSVDMFLRQRWTDPRLRFTSTSDKEVLSLNYMRDRLWIPDLFFRNAKEGRLHTITTPNLLLWVYPDWGSVLFSQKLSVKLDCPMTLWNFPMDSQVCRVEMGSYGYSLDQLELVWNEDQQVELNRKMQVNEFEFPRLRHGACMKAYNSTGRFACLYLEFHLVRKFGFYLIYTYLPSILVVMLSWVSFWIDYQAVPARISLGLLSILALITQAAATLQKLPRVSYIKAIDVWLFACLAFVVLSLLEFSLVNVLTRRRTCSSRQQRRRQQFRCHGNGLHRLRRTVSNSLATGEQTPESPLLLRKRLLLTPELETSRQRGLDDDAYQPPAEGFDIDEENGDNFDGLNDGSFGDTSVPSPPPRVAMTTPGWPGPIGFGSACRQTRRRRWRREHQSRLRGCSAGQLQQQHQLRHASLQWLTAQQLDRVSIFLFPFSFAAFNAAYWTNCPPRFARRRFARGDLPAELFLPRFARSAICPQEICPQGVCPPSFSCRDLPAVQFARRRFARRGFARRAFPAVICPQCNLPASELPAEICPPRFARGDLPAEICPRRFARGDLPAEICPRDLPAEICPRRFARGDLPASELPAEICPRRFPQCFFLYKDLMRLAAEKLLKQIAAASNVLKSCDDGALGEGSEDNAEEASGIQDSATLEGANLMETMKMLLTHQSQQLQEMTRAQERQSAFYLEQLARQQAEFTKLLAESKPRPQAAEPKLFKLTDSDDIEAFLMTFERAAASCGWQKSEWTIRLAPLLTGVAQSAFHSLTTAASADYDLAKATILARYNIGEETYRQRFRSLRKAPEETFQVFATKLEDLFVRWMTAGLDEDQREELISGDSIVRQKVLLEQFTDSLTRGLQVWMRERKPKDIKEAAKLADDYAMARNSDKGGGTPGHPSQETSEGATASNAMDKQRTIQRPQSLKPKISCFNCGGPHKKFQCTNKPANVHLASEERAMDAASGRFITGHADGKELRFLMDTGADRTTIRRSCLPENINWTGHHALLRCFGGDLHRLPIAKVELHLKGYNRTTEGDERLFAEGIVASGLNQIDPEPAGKTKSRITRAQARKQRQEYNKTRQETAMRPITLDYEAALQDDKELQAAVQTNDLVKESRGRLFRHQAAGEDQLKYNSREAVLMQLPAAATSAPELSEHLTPAERDRLLQLVQDFAGVFSEIPGRTDLNATKALKAVMHKMNAESDGQHSPPLLS